MHVQYIVYPIYEEQLMAGPWIKSLQGNKGSLEEERKLLFDDAMRGVSAARTAMMWS